MQLFRANASAKIFNGSVFRGYCSNLSLTAPVLSEIGTIACSDLTPREATMALLKYF